MRHSPVVRLGVAAVACSVVTTAYSWAQPSGPHIGTASAARGSIPRTADGHPNLEGYWSFGTATPLERPPQVSGRPFFADDAEAERFETENEARRQALRAERLGVEEVREAERPFVIVDGRKLTSLIVDPPDGRIPYIAPERQQRLLPERYDGPEDVPLSERCLSGASGVPLFPAAAPPNVQVFQSPDHLVLLQEFGPEIRIIPFDGRKHVSGAIRSWSGHSSGHWDGDTLVVETTNFRARLQQRAASNRFDRNLRLVERLTLTAANVIWYEVTIDDPTLFTRTWTLRFPMRRKNEQVLEFACHEGNYSLANVLRGARAQDRAAGAGNAIDQK